jgi:hypothetical protein
MSKAAYSDFNRAAASWSSRRLRRTSARNGRKTWPRIAITLAKEDSHGDEGRQNDARLIQRAFLAAGYRGSPAGTVAPGPQGATYAQDPAAGGAMTPARPEGPMLLGRTDRLRRSAGEPDQSARSTGQGRSGGLAHQPAIAAIFCTT